MKQDSHLYVCFLHVSTLVFQFLPGLILLHKAFVMTDISVEISYCNQFPEKAIKK